MFVRACTLCKRNVHQVKRRANFAERHRGTRFYLPTRRNPVHFPSTLYADSPSFSLCLSLSFSFSPCSPFYPISPLLSPVTSIIPVCSLVLETNYRASCASAILALLAPLNTGLPFLCLISRLNLHKNVRRILLDVSSLFGHYIHYLIAIIATCRQVSESFKYDFASHIDHFLILYDILH